MQSLLKKVITTILQSQVKRLVANHELKVVGITGSVGKTSTKYAVSHVLERAYKTLSGKGNYNSEIGMPLSLFEEQVLSTVRDVWSWL